MELRDLAVEFRGRGFVARAVDGVSLEWRKGEILGIVGESGCGKSTLARAMLQLVEPAGGEIALDGAPIDATDGHAELRRRLQMIFQDPYQTLNPRQRVRTIVTEPLKVQGVDAGEHERGCTRRSTTSASTPSASASATPTSSPAASASGWRSRPRSCSSPTG